MTMRSTLLALAMGLPLAWPWTTAMADDGGYAAHDRSRLALSHPAPALDARAREAFAAGRAIFSQPWLVAPSSAQPEFDGLGPLYNRLSCAGCHLHAGRGDMPDGADEPLHAAIVRLSVLDMHGARPDPVYGTQLQTVGIPGVPAEGRATVDWQASSRTLADGSVVPMRAPRLRISALAYGPLGRGSRTSLRLAPPLVGLGWLEAIPAGDVAAQAVAERRGPDGVYGEVNRVYDVRSGRLELGRFGLKANQASVRQQVETALYQDMGISSTDFPTQDCSAAERACRKAPNGGRPEATRAQVDALVAYVRGLAVPARVHADAPAVRAGERLFARIGCAACHRPTWRTGDFPAFPALSRRTIHPYTDLLLHDMGAGLADGRPDGQASGRQWRTAPLWGLGLDGAADGQPLYLHDGRARSLAEAILWHGGEAAPARARYRRLDAARRAELAAFLASL